jgi:hypothetical protein
MSKEQQTTTVECGLEGASHHSTDEIRGQSVVANGEAGNHTGWLETGTARDLLGKM